MTLYEFVVILHCIYEAAVLLTLHNGMYCFSWMDRDELEMSAFLSLIIPAIYTPSAFATAWGLGLTAPSNAKTVVLIADFVMFAASVAAAALFSIKKYREEGYKPNYAAFLIVAGYSFILTFGSALFVWLF